MSESMKIRPGEIVRVGNKLYGVCNDCHGIIRIDKPIFGSLHICEPPNNSVRTR